MDGWRVAMRSLYWLTAITLVAAAVTTVAIADYGRRHPQSFAGALMNARLDKEPVVPVSQPKQGYGYAQPSVEVSSPVPPPLALSQPFPHPPISFDIPSIPPSQATPPVFTPRTSSRITVGQHLRTEGPRATPPAAPSLEMPVPPAVLPSSPPQPEPIDIAKVPEHQTLRKEALRNLESLQVELTTPSLKTPSLDLTASSTSLDSKIPPLPVTKQAVDVPVTKKSMDVVDEFTFDQKPLAPLYVPIAPETKVIVPPPQVVKDVVKLPRIPGVSAGNQFNTPRPETLEVVRGPEIMPGLHAAAPVEAFNPVQDTLLTLGELFTAMNPATYLLSMPIDKKATKPATTTSAPTTFASTDTAPPTTPTEVVVEGHCVTKDAANCSKAGTCCKNASSCSDEVAVRTYSVAEFTTTSGTNHEELIRLITTMVAPDAWNTKDATIEYFALGKCLVIRQRSAVQDQVEDLLTQLRSQVQRQNKGPVISQERTLTVPANLEMVPVTPRENCEKMPRVITIEPDRCHENELSTLMPITPDGRLKAVPMTLPRVDASVLVPAQFETKTVETGWFEDGPVTKNVYRKVPDFFPLHLPYAPLPQAPATYEEQLLNRVGYVNYTDEEVDMIMMLAFECDE